jgi:hypothetical protein
VLWCQIGEYQESKGFHTWREAVESWGQLFDALVSDGWLPQQSES